MRIACAQYALSEGDRDHNLERSLRFIRRAATEEADLVVLPELANSGCDLGPRERALQFAEEVPDGPTARTWRMEAENSGICVVGGLCWKEKETPCTTQPSC